MSKLPSESMNQLVNLLQDEVTELEVPQLSWRILSESDIKELAAMPLEEVARWAARERGRDRPYSPQVV